MPEPQLSVIVPNYNYAHFLDETLSSVMAQTLQDWELVVIDDGSSNDSLAVIGLFQATDSRVRLFTHPGHANKGLSASLQLGLSVARAPYVAFLEADDALAPDSLEKRLALHRQTGARMVFSSFSLRVMSLVTTSFFYGSTSLHCTGRERLLSHWGRWNWGETVFPPFLVSLWKKNCCMNVPLMRRTTSGSTGDCGRNVPTSPFLLFWMSR